VACLEGALPRGMVGRLAAALGPSSPFWASHGYICDGVRLASPFFSYVHSLRGPPASGLDRAIRRLQRLAAAAMPEVAEAGHAEWWAHCRPHATGHQMHFDSADEGRGARGPRHPLVSCALFLTSSAGGPPVDSHKCTSPGGRNATTGQRQSDTQHRGPREGEQTSSRAHRRASEAAAHRPHAWTQERTR